MRNVSFIMLVSLLFICSISSCKKEEGLLAAQVSTSPGNTSDAFDANDPIALASFYLLVKSVTTARVETDPATQANAYNVLGIDKDLKVLYSESLTYHQKAISLRLALADKAALAKSYNNIAVVFKEQKNYTKAEYYYSLALNQFRSLGLSAWEAHTIRNLGLALEAQKKYKDAKSKYSEALAIWQKLNIQTQIENLTNDLNVIRQLDPTARKKGEAFPRGGEIRGL